MSEGKTEKYIERELRCWPSTGLTSYFNEGPNNPQWLLHKEGLSKGMLLTLHDTLASRENTGMHRLRDEWMQECTAGLVEDEGRNDWPVEAVVRNWMGRSLNR